MGRKPQYVQVACVGGYDCLPVWHFYCDRMVCGLDVDCRGSIDEEVPGCSRVGYRIFDGIRKSFSVEYEARMFEVREIISLDDGVPC